MDNTKRKVSVLLATHNGMQWLEEQVETILAQDNVDVRLIVSDDASSDGTLQWLQQLAIHEKRVSILADTSSIGAAGKNFYRLIKQADIGDADYIAFADQDDVWLRNKLFYQINLIEQNKLTGCSSNVVAFWREGANQLVNKAGPIKEFDFLFESAGPGCSFIFKPELFFQLKNILLKIDPQSLPERHDWLVYAVCRAQGLNWFICPRPTLRYRQHHLNVVGVNYGYRAGLKRLSNIYNGWYRKEAQKIARIVIANSKDAQTHKLCKLILKLGPLERLELLTHIHKFRRNNKDVFILGFVLTSFIF